MAERAPESYRGPEPLDTKHGDSGPEPQLVEVDVLSAWCIRRASSIFSGFRGHKARLIDSIGFAGSRLLGKRGFPDAEMSMWLLGNLDTKSMTLKYLKGLCKLPMSDRDVHLGLGLRYHGVEVDDSANVPAATMEFIRRALFLRERGSMITVEQLEEILTKDYGDDMSAGDDRCATKPRLWVSSVDTSMSDGCRKYNSGVFTAHYARWYEGPGLLRPITSSAIFDTRADLRYQLLMMGGNVAELPDEFYSL